MNDIAPQLYREVLGQYPTGVTAITTLLPDGTATAMIVGTFSAVSISPPLVAYMPRRESTSFAEMRTSTHFVANILSREQEDLCRRLARTSPDKLANERWHLSERGLPILDDVVAAVECEVESITEAGDHYIVLGRVLHLETLNPTIPLLFFRGGYGGFAPSATLLARGAEDLTSAVERASILRPHLSEAASTFDAEISIFARVSDIAVAVASATPENGDPVTTLGTRHPLVPPIGVPYVAWSDPEDQEAWVDRAIGASEADRIRFRRDLADARQHGWSVAVQSEEANDELDDDAWSDLPRRIVSRVRYQEINEISADAKYSVTALMAPVVQGKGIAPDLMFRVLFHPPIALSGAELRERGEALKALSEAASTQLSAPH